MTIETIADRIDKVKERIGKKSKTIANKTKLLEKKKRQVIDAGYDLKDKDSMRDNLPIFWLACDVEDLEGDLRRLPKEIEELEKTLADYEDQLAGARAKEATYATEVPKCLKALEQELVDKWTAYDTARRDAVKADRSALPWKEFTRKYRRYDINQLVYKTGDEILRDNEKDAKAFVLNLYNRIENITGEVTDWSGIELAPGARGSATLNGVVTGVKGKCRVESIYAEGPVQRLHVRVLTKEIN